MDRSCQTPVKRKDSGKVNPRGSRRNGWWLLLAALIVVSAAAAWFARHTPRSPATAEHYVPRPAGTVTFNKHIAPIVYRQCGDCHRPGQSAPFSLITFADVKKRAKQVGVVTRDGLMPPWLPDPELVRFADERRLTAEELGLIQQWVSDGAPEGSPNDLPPPPQWPNGWQLGTPDLVVTMPDTYLLAADGKDIYRNFVIPVPLDRQRHVRAVEFRFDSRAVHHAITRIDRTKQSRRLDALDPAPGFGGMDAPASTEGAGGHFLSWQPGRGPTRFPEGLAWTLQPGTDLIMQVHMQPTGKPEPVRPSVALYFTEAAPTNRSAKIGLGSYAIDIPAGATDYTLQDSYVLPIDAQIVAVLPHTHYLGKRLEGLATLPDGTTRWLLAIKNWDFSWQSDYRYAEPISLPKGTRLSMRYTYDNSTNNVRNPNQPPIRVQYGLQSKDEMGELWIQLLAKDGKDLATFENDYSRRVITDIVTFNQLQLARDPGDAHAHIQLGKALMSLGRSSEALSHFRAAASADPNADEAYYHLGLLAMDRKDDGEAETRFNRVLQINPDHFKARNNLGLLCLNQGRLAEAEAHFNEVLRLNPGDALAQNNLRIVARAKGGGR